MKKTVISLCRITSKNQTQRFLMLFFYLWMLLTITFVIGCTLSAGGFQSQTIDADRTNIDSIPNTEKIDADKIRLAIPVFIKRYGNNRYDVLQRALPEIVAAGLIENDNVIYVGHDQFWKTVSMKQNIERYRRDPDRIFDDEILEELGIDLILRGTFFEYKGKIRLEATLSNRKEQSQVKISSQVVDTRALLSGVMDLTRELDAEIRTMALHAKARKVAILCFTDNSVRPSKEYKNIGQNLAIALITNLDLREDLAVLPWSVTKHACDADRMDGRQLLEDLSADAVLIGLLSVESDTISISPRLFLKGASEYVDLNPLKGDLKNYYEFEDHLTKEIRALIESLAMPDGGWDLAGLETRSKDRRYLMSEGKVLMTQSAKQSLASLMFKRAVEIDYKDSEAQYYLGLTKYNQQRYMEAIEEFRRAVEINPKLSQAWEKMGDAYLELNEYKKALAAYQKTSNIAPQTSGIHFKIGKVGMLVNRYDIAVPELEQAVAEAPEQTEIRIFLADAYATSGDYRKALKLYGELNVMPSKDEQLSNELFNKHVEHGRALIRQKRYAEAVDFLQAASLIRSDPAVYALLIDLYNREEKYLKAFQIFQKARDLDIADAEIWHLYGWSAYRMKKFPEALNAFYQAIDLEPDVGNYYNSCGWVLDKMDRIRKAIDAYKTAVKIEPKLVKAYNNMAYDLILLQRYDEAIQTAEKAIEILPSYANPYNQKGFAMYRLGKFEEGLDFILNSIRINPGYGGAHFNLAVIYAEKYEWPIALSYLRDAIRIDSNYKEIAISHPAFSPYKNRKEFQEIINIRE